MVSIERGIEILRGSFRGLWVSKEISEDGSIIEGWAVTFEHNGEMVETRYQVTPREAINFALRIKGFKA